MRLWLIMGLFLLMAAAHAADAVAGAGNGLRGEFFTGRDLTTRVAVRRDAVLDFGAYKDQVLDPAVGNTELSARWSGQVQPRYSETYTFTTVSDDGVRLWVDGQLLIDNWSEHGDTENSGTIDLVAGKKYDIKLEFFQGGGGWTIRLFWSSAGQAREIIPQSQLYSPLIDGHVVFDDNADVMKSAVWTVNGDGTLTKYPEPTAGEPALHPAGKSFAYTSGRNATWVDPKAPRNTEIYVMTVEGGNVRRLRGSPEGDETPAYSPDGKHIAFSSNRTGAWEIFTMNGEGGRVKQITTDKAENRRPAFTADSKQIAYQSKRDGQWNIYLIDLETGEETPVTTKGGRQPAFSPDGKQMAFVAEVDGAPQLYLMNMESKEITRLTKDTAADTTPVFSPEGNDLAFVSTRDNKEGDVYILEVRSGKSWRLTTNAHPVNVSWGE